MSTYARKQFAGSLFESGADTKQVALVVDEIIGDQIIEAFTDGDTTPSVATPNALFKTSNTGATTITDLDDGYSGQVVTVLFGDANTTVDFTASGLVGNGGADWTPAVNDSMRCIFDGTDWYCCVCSASGGGASLPTGTAEGNTLYWDNTGAAWVENTSVKWIAADSQMLFPEDNDQLTPTIGFGDGSYGFHGNSDDVVAVVLAGVNRFFFQGAGNYLTGSSSSSFYCNNAVSSRTVPTLGPRRDFDTGIGSAGNDEMSLICGSIEMLRLVEGINDYLHAQVPLFMVERGTPVANIAGSGQLWVKNDTPNTLWFRNDAGTDVQLGSGISNVVEDTSPQLGGDLDAQTHAISGSGTIDMAPNARSVSATGNTATTDYSKVINLTGGSGQTFTLDGDPPTNAIIFIDNSSGNSWTLAASTSLIWAKDATTGNRTLADDGVAIAKHRGSGTWVISGSDLLT